MSNTYFNDPNAGFQPSQNPRSVVSQNPPPSYTTHKLNVQNDDTPLPLPGTSRLDRTPTESSSQVFNFRDDNSLYPSDSASQVAGPEDGSSVAGGPGGKGVTVFKGGDFLTQDPYARSNLGGGSGGYRGGPGDDVTVVAGNQPTRNNSGASSNYPPTALAPATLAAGAGARAGATDVSSSIYSQYPPRGPHENPPSTYSSREPYPTSNYYDDPFDSTPHELHNGGLYDPYGAGEGHGRGYTGSTTLADHGVHGKDNSSFMKYGDDDVPLVAGAAGMGGRDSYPSGKVPYAPLNYADGGDPEAQNKLALDDERDPPFVAPKDPTLAGAGGLPPKSKRPNVFMRNLRDPSSTQEKVDNYRRGVGVQRLAVACWVLAVGMVVAFIVEIADNWKQMGSPIATSPFNPMIGPSSEVLINVGARFTPCMKSTHLDNTQFTCLDDPKGKSGDTCSLSEICGFGGFHGDPDQTFRFVLPIFLHAGLIHILLNLVAQFTSSADVERQMGSLRFIILYVPAGVFGFILGGNYALLAQPSVGASGAIFGTHAAVLVDLLAHWTLERRPWRKLTFLIIEIIIGFALGLVPGVDNFAHLGGFAAGIMGSILLYPVIHQTRTHRLVFYALRVIALPLLILSFVLLIKNFNTDDPSSGCSWCRYLSCWPTSSNNHCKGDGLQRQQTTTSSTSNKALAVIMVLDLLRRRLWKSESFR